MRSLSISLITGQILTILFFRQKLPPEIPLFYSCPWGKEQLTNPSSLFILPFLSLVILLGNSTFSYLTSKHFLKEKKLLPKIMDAATVAFSIFCLTTLIKIILLIT